MTYNKLIDYTMEELEDEIDDLIMDQNKLKALELHKLKLELEALKQQKDHNNHIRFFIAISAIMTFINILINVI